MNRLHSNEAMMTQDWLVQLRCAVRDPVRLCELLDLNSNVALSAKRAHQLFPILATHSYINRMEIGNPVDPLLLQVLPRLQEAQTAGGDFQADPLGEAKVESSPGVLQKYTGRALVVSTSTCAVHCRYCFRRHYPYEDLPKNNLEWQTSLANIANDKSITEVIISGGDPLTLVDDRFFFMMHAIAKHAHVETIRIHTRIPVVLPARISEGFLQNLQALPKQIVFVIHANHANEIRFDCSDALIRLKSAGFVLMNQSVLLRGINDSAAAQEQLSRALTKHGVLPYYLHQLDKVEGASHFDVSIAKGIEVIDSLRQTLPGYMVPRYVQEIPGQPSKTPIA